MSEFTPKLFTLLKAGISKAQLRRDVLAGITVGIVALPLAIAFAVASGVSPEKGLITAVIAGFIISAFGGSRVQIGGPTGAFIVIVFGIVQEYGVGGLMVATFMAGFIIIGLGLARLGNLLRFIPYPLIVGFTAGIALIIFSSQVSDFLGYPAGNVPADLLPKWEYYLHHLPAINGYALSLGLGTVAVALFFHRITTKVPGSMVAIVLGAVVVHAFNLPVETLGSRFGELPRGFPAPSFPGLQFSEIRHLIQPAFAIALLGAIESLLSAVVADGMIGGRHRPNAELIAQGGANIFSALLGGIPATGAIARTATNVKNGGRTPISGIVHALVLLLVMLVFAPYAVHIPMPVLAGILVVVAYHMGEWKQFAVLVRSGQRGEILILLTTFLLTVVFDLIIAIEVGVILSAFVLMKRLSEAVSVSPRALPDGKELLFEEELGHVPKDVALYEIEGPLFFGASQAFEDAITNVHLTPKVLILRMRHVSFIDGTGIQKLKAVISKFRRQQVQVILSGLNETVRNDLERSGIHEVLDPDNMAGTIGEALLRAKELVRPGSPV